MITDVVVKRYNKADKPTVESDYVASEISYPIVHGGKELEIVECSPEELDELRVGWLYVHGYSQEIASLGKLDACKVDAMRTEPLYLDYDKENARVRNYMIIAGEMLNLAENYEKTGSMHCAALASQKEICYYCEDLSRKNAVMKVIGKCLLNSDKPDSFVLFTSGGLPLSVVRLSRAVGIRTIVSRSAPTDAALALARKAGIRIFGFADKEMLKAYE